MQHEPSPALRAFSTFTDAAHGVVQFLQHRFGMQMWMVTRTAGNDWIVLANADQGYGVAEGTVLRWSDSFCSRMVRGEGPNLAADVTKFPQYESAPIAQQVRIGSYVGLPLVLDDGALFGTLCAIDPLPQTRSLEGDMPMLGLLSRLLTSLLQRDIARLRQARPRGLAIPDAPEALLLEEASWTRNLSGLDQEAACLGLRLGLVAIDLHERAAAPADSGDPMPLLGRLAAAIDVPSTFAMRGHGRIVATLAQVGALHEDDLQRRLLAALAASGCRGATIRVVALPLGESLRARAHELMG